MIEKKNILGVGITNATEEEILEYIVDFIKNQQKKLFIITPNPEFLVFAHHHNSFKTILNKSDLALADGVGVLWASKVLKKPLKARVTGVDLMEKLCEKIHNRPVTVGFLGGRDGVAEKTAECLMKKYSGLKVGFASKDWNFSRLPHVATDARSPKNLNSSLYPSSLSESRPPDDVLNSKKTRATFNSVASGKAPFIDILFVAYGFPKQEEWIYDNLENIPVKVAMGVGGAFDYISGKMPRAPRVLQKLGLEWLFRLIVQPWRIKRQLALIEFVWLVIKAKYGF